MKGKAAFTFICVLLFVAGSAGMSEQDHSSSLYIGKEVPGVFQEDLPDHNITCCEGDERNGSENGGEDPAGSTDTNGLTPSVLDSPAHALFDEIAVNHTPSLTSVDLPKQKVSAPSADGELIVTFRTEPGKGMDKAAVDSAHKRAGASIKKDFSGKGLLGTQVVKIPPGLTIDEAIALYEGDVEVLSVQPNYRIELMDVPDDPDFSLQWALLNLEHPGADIGAVYAWDITNGDGGVLIAIPDTGIGVSHPDLAANIWFNTDEIFGNEIDDDGNGYIDDVQGWDFVNGDADPSDDNGHGTHVAGIVGAVGNNGIGISGVMWDTRILPLKVIGKDGYGYESDAIEAILYAQSVGAHIISISWGSYGESQALKDAIDHYPGLVVCAAGNSARDNDLYPIFPASFSSLNIISVTATDEQDGLASFANFGAGSVDIAAPGVGIHSTVPGSGYNIRSGTSMAAPYVTGAAGLVLSVDGDLDGPELVEILRSSVDHLDSLEGKVSFSGRVNAEKALLMAMDDLNITPLPTMPSPTPSVTVTPTQIPVAPGGGPQVAPLNPDFINYLKSYQTGTSQAIDERYGLGYIPAPLDMSYLQGQILQFSENTLFSLPTHYDLRTLDRVTPVGNQGPCGSCWAFATYGSMESVLMPGEEWHLSENNLKNLNGFDNSPCEGGNYEMSTAYLTRWDGPVTEASDPYNPFSGVSPTGIPPAIHVQDVLFIPMRSGPLDNDNIKNAIMTYGGVGTGFFWKDTYYSPSYSSYYYSGSKDKDNHAVTLVGWNDDYSKKKFTYRPPGNGAFLVKNSWGTSWGNGGYFWVSYYDNRIGRYFTNAVFLTQPTNNYDDIYQYDPLGWVSSIGYGSTTAWGANVFTSAQNEQLRAIGFYAASPNTAYEVYVYKNLTSGPMNPEGEVSFISGTIAIPGYHTLPLDTPVAVNAGETFSIVVKLVTPGNKYPIPFESPIFGYSSRATAEPGQSYISYDGSDWQDLFTAVENANVCVKGYTQDERWHVGVFRGNTWYLDYNGNGIWDGGVTDRQYNFGLTGDIPVSGDWNALGKTSTGVFRPDTHTFYLDWNGNGKWDGGVTDRAFNFGLTDDIPVTGDWASLGKTSIGVFRPSTRTFYLDWNGNGRWDGGVTDREYNFGLTGDIPVSGDWDALGKTSIGVYRPSTRTFYLDWNGNGRWDGGVTDRAFNFGLTDDIPVTGDWNALGKTGIGVFRPSTHIYYLDWNGNGVWNGPATDRQYTFGLLGDVPVTGAW